MAKRDHQFENWEAELVKRLKKLEYFLDFKNHSYCKSYLGEIIDDFLENGVEKFKETKEVCKNERIEKI